MRKDRLEEMVRSWRSVQPHPSVLRVRRRVPRILRVPQALQSFRVVVHRELVLDLAVDVALETLRENLDNESRAGT